MKSLVEGGGLSQGGCWCMATERLRQPMVDDVILRWKDVAWGVGVTLACVGRKVFVRKNFQKLHSISVL